MDRTGDHYAKWNKPDGEGQILYDLTFNWNIINRRKKETKYNQRHWSAYFSITSQSEKESDSPEHDQFPCYLKLNAEGKVVMTPQWINDAAFPLEPGDQQCQLHTELKLHAHVPLNPNKMHAWLND